MVKYELLKYIIEDTNAIYLPANVIIVGSEKQTFDNGKTWVTALLYLRRNGEQ